MKNMSLHRAFRADRSKAGIAAAFLLLVTSASAYLLQQDRLAHAAAPESPDSQVVTYAGGNMTVRLSHGLTAEIATANRITFGFAVLFLWAASGAVAQTPERLAQDPLAGSEAFQAKGCIKCHSVNGLGGSSASDLGEIPRRRSFYELGATLWNHAPLMGEGMGSYGIEHPEMSPAEAGDLIGFLFFLRYFDPPGNVSVGKRLFNEKKCSACHQNAN